MAQIIRSPSIKRTILQRSDVLGTNYETVLGIAEIAPNADFSSHPSGDGKRLSHRR